MRTTPSRAECSSALTMLRSSTCSSTRSSETPSRNGIRAAARPVTPRSGCSPSPRRARFHVATLRARSAFASAAPTCARSCPRSRAHPPPTRTSKRVAAPRVRWRRVPSRRAARASASFLRASFGREEARRPCLPSVDLSALTPAALHRRSRSPIWLECPHGSSRSSGELRSGEGAAAAWARAGEADAPSDERDVKADSRPPRRPRRGTDKDAAGTRLPAARPPAAPPAAPPARLRRTRYRVRNRGATRRRRTWSRRPSAGRSYRSACATTSGRCTATRIG